MKLLSVLFLLLPAALFAQCSSGGGHDLAGILSITDEPCEQQVTETKDSIVVVQRYCLMQTGECIKCHQVITQPRKEQYRYAFKRKE